MTITAEEARKLLDTVAGIQTPRMCGDNLAILLCSYFDDGEPNPDSDTGWSEAAEQGYDEVVQAIRKHFAPVVDAIIDLQAQLAEARAEVERMREALTAEREEVLWNAYHTGHEKDGQWDHCCMSDGEWLVRECGFDPNGRVYSADVIKAAIPVAARAALNPQAGKHGGSRQPPTIDVTGPAPPSK